MKINDNDKADTAKIGILKKLLLAFAICCAAGILLFCGINIYVITVTDKYILTLEEAQSLDADAIVVLGAKVSNSGRPGYMLASRLDMGIELYERGVSDKLLLSGDHGKNEYNEVGGMFLYALEKNVPAEDVFLDHAGFSTYESAVRAKKIFCANRAVMVTQAYHLPRAVYCARSVGIEAYGVASDSIRWKGLPYFMLRESIAVVKDFFGCLIGVEPTYLGETIPVSGSAESTHDLENNIYTQQ